MAPKEYVSEIKLAQYSVSDTVTFVEQRSAPSCLSVFPVHDKGSLALNVPVTYSVKRLFNQRDVS